MRDHLHAQKQPVEPHLVREQTLRETLAPPIIHQPLCIQPPNGGENFELKLVMVQLLPKFLGLQSEDPYRHLKELYLICSGFKPRGVTDDQIQLRAFPFSLDGAAKEWFLDLPPGTVGTWVDMAKLFLERFFPASRVANLRREICNIRQLDSEFLHEYWERFWKMCATCPQHGLTEQLLILFFYEGLLNDERSLIDAASGGTLFNKTPEAAKELISDMAYNSQQFNTPPNSTTSGVHEVQSSNLESKLDEITDLLKKSLIINASAMNKVQRATVCGLCHNQEPATDAWSTVQGDEAVNAMDDYGNQQRRYDPNFRYGSVSNQQGYQPRQSQQKKQSNDDDLKLLLTTFIEKNEHRMRVMEASVAELKAEITKLHSLIKKKQKPSDDEEEIEVVLSHPSFAR